MTEIFILGLGPILLLTALTITGWTADSDGYKSKMTPSYKLFDPTLIEAIPFSTV